MATIVPGPHGRATADLISDCVHCGFCLPACPTYKSWGLEADSPRGRIDLMKGIEQQTVAIDATVVRHFDQCLGCMACVTACPSGVQYGTLIERTRATVEQRYQRGSLDRFFRAFVFAIFPYPRRLRALSYPLYVLSASGLQGLLRRSGLLKLLPERLRQLDALAPRLTAADLGAGAAPFTAARGERRGRVTLVAGCVQRVFFPRVNAATVRVLAAEGYDVAVTPGQGCCGALSLHGGRDDEARRFARDLIDRLAPADGSQAGFDAILVNAAGCGSTLKEYGELLADDPAYAARAAAFAARVRDVTEFVGGIEPRAPRQPLPLRVAYHEACHLAHAQGVREQPRALLHSIPELELFEIPDGDQCCGSAGVYNLMQPASAREIGERKVANVLSVRADLLASANPGCTLQMRSILADRGERLRAAHPIEILDAAIAGTVLDGS